MLEQRQIYNKKLRKENKELRKGRDRTHYIKNRDKKINQAKEYYEKNKESIN